MAWNTFWDLSGLYSWSIIIQCIYMWRFYVPTQKMVLLITLMILPIRNRYRNYNIISDLEHASDILSNWFLDNYLKANPDKYHVFLSETSETQLISKIFPIASSCCEKLLWIKVDHKLSFEPHVESLCKKSQSKTQCIGTDALFLKVQTTKIIIKRIYYSPFLLSTSCLDVSF